MKLKDKESLKDWESFSKAIKLATTIDVDENPVAKRKRIEALLSDEIAFFKYYFPHYAKSDFSASHKRFFKKLIANKRIFMIRACYRSWAKSVCAGVFAPIFLWAKGELKNMIIASHNWDNAAELLMPLQVEFESNQRLINDFGIIKSIGTWEKGKFITSNGCSFRAVGSGQSPRGTRNQEARPDYILFDDLDEDEQCRNPKRMGEAEEWLIGALRGCFDIIGTARMVGVGNIIAKDTLIKRCIPLADDFEQIDLLEKGKPNTDLIKSCERTLKNSVNAQEKKLAKEVLDYAKAGWKPSWSERNGLADCVYMISKMGYRLSQREYFNNPISEGKVFKKSWMQFKPMPPLSSYKFLVAYLDPGFKKTKTTDTKSLILMGLLNGEFHVRKVFCGQASIEEMIEWCYSIDSFVKSKGAAYRLWMEEVFLQDLLYKDFAEAAKRKGYPVPVMGDKRKKPDKDSRIEGLQGYFERGSWYFDEEIENDHHCQELVDQFLNFEPGVKTKKDGPDACEGGAEKLQLSVSLNVDFKVGTKHINNKRI